jgi:hypothetical protein
MGRLGDLGYVCLVKVDGEREHHVWTVLISGGALASAYVRSEGHSVDYCMTDTLAKLRIQVPDLPSL